MIPNMPPEQKECITSETKTAKESKKTFEQFSLWIELDDGSTKELPYLMRYQLNNLVDNLGEHTPDWIGQAIEIFFEKTGNYANFTLKAISEFSEEVIKP